MGNLIAVGLHIANRISSESFVVFLPVHKAVYDAIARRDAEGARVIMQHLLSETHEFMNHHIHALPRQEPENP